MASQVIGTTVSIALSASASAATYELSFRWAALQKTQARFKGRTVLEPEIDLGRYTCRAVIDWLDVRVVVGATTQWKWIQDHLEKATGQRLYVDDVKDEQGTTGRRFRIRFQEPLVGRVMQAIDLVAERWTLEGAPELVGLEISLDLTPKVYSEEDLARLFGVIARTHLPSRDVITEPSDRPRFFAVNQRGTRRTRHVINMSKTAPHKNHGLLVRHDRDISPTYDSTYYTGAEDSDLSWRLMVKRIDMQNKAAGTFIKIPDEKLRVRLEVTLLEHELLQAGLRTLEDMANFRFQTLQGSYFKFRLPTFRQDDDARQQKFLKAGVVGLEAMDDARTSLRQAIVNASRKSDKPLQPAPRLGSSLTIYQDLTKKVVQALRHLRERQQGSLRN